ncbi:testicular haploid expressed gene protein-like protein [Lates japonicus]|uniref:Testicular haploid expressed gene protein-like protein n=1 Tax=Lates japonicus TaxID=270547 RepID=A0AAD3NED5_LATJO|nr:testicular haploid expressed gene protein-like protein [Lates japonicus]
MFSDKQGVQSRFGPSHRILELAQHKTSKTVWATTPCEKLSWGNQEPIWPLSASTLGAGPSTRIQYLAKHKGDFSAREDHQRRRLRRVAASRRAHDSQLVQLSLPRLKRQHLLSGSDVQESSGL